MKKIVLVSLMLMSLPMLVKAQDVNDDLYFIPTKKTETKKEVKQTDRPTVVVESNRTNVYSGNGKTVVVVNDKKGYTRDVDEYNRRYTSRDNNFTLQDDTLYIDEKPVGERGEWVNGFKGSQSDYEYAMRLVRFRNPRFAVSISSPLYWDMIYMLPSWEWNVYVDDFYAYAFPTYSNRLWWDWRFNYPYGYGWGWNSPWYYSSWYSPWYYDSWYSPWYYGGWYGWGGYWTRPWYYAGWYGPGYWGGGHVYGWYGSSRRFSGIHNDRYVNNYDRGRSNYYDRTPAARSNYDRSGRYTRSNGSAYDDNGRNANNYRTRNSGADSYTRSGNSYSGRIVSGNDNGSVRPSSSRTRTGGGVVSGSNSDSYTRSSGGTYNRPSSTRQSARESNSYNGAAQRGAYRSSESGRYNRSYTPDAGSVTRSSNNSGYSPSGSSFGGGSNRSSGGNYGSGGSRSSGSSGGGGGASRRR
ncbi:hypothetical protein [Phocaeicola abscessus]|uniref:hypothetical protein n=1 Tax=Phocaeicola abscessus TaxID=555313 RepID=UPI0028E79AF6|nr:hypothetical protein [Phocaeicola abscessus]